MCFVADLKIDKKLYDNRKIGFETSSEVDDNNSPSTLLAMSRRDSTPAFLTLKETRGNNVFISLTGSSTCHRRTDQPLASASVFVDVFFGKGKRYGK